MTQLNEQDFELLQTVTAKWGAVQRENFSDRALVTEQEWEQWEKFDASTSGRLASIVESFSYSLDAADRLFLKNLQQRIAGAKRLTTEELWLRQCDLALEESRREQLRGNFIAPQETDHA